MSRLSFLLLALAVTVGCEEPPAIKNVAAAGADPIPAAPTERAVSPVARELGLGETVSIQQAMELERRVKDQGAYVGVGCGITTDSDGESRGYYSNIYQIRRPGSEQPLTLSFGHIQHGTHPMTDFTGPDFLYRLERDRFVFHPYPPEPPVESSDER